MYRSSLLMFGGGILVVGVAMGMLFERLMLPSPAPVVQPAVVQVTAPPAQK